MIHYSPDIELSLVKSLLDEVIEAKQLAINDENYEEADKYFNIEKELLLEIKKLENNE